MKLVIPNWHPYRLNQLLGVHWAVRGRMKREDREMVAVYARLQGLPQARTKRKVDLLITLARGQRAGDPDNWWKSVLDAIRYAGLIVDDSAKWCELGLVRFDRGKCPATTIELTVIPEEARVVR